MNTGKFCCQICSFDFMTVRSFKVHLGSSKHKKQYLKIYPNDVFKWDEFSCTPWIFCKDRDSKQPCSGSILGLSQMTLCFCSDERIAFYLCHVCEQKLKIVEVVGHISHADHFNNYFAYKDPNALTFLSTTSENKMLSLKDSIKEELEKTGTGELQVLHIPEKLFHECKPRNYCQVMFLLYQKKSLSNLFKERKPERMWLQTYKDISNRKHPLLGLQHIVECVCTPYIHLRHYLCTLCRLHVSSSMIIRHLLSFDHISTYHGKLHPSTEECNRADHTCRLTEFVKQSEERHDPQEIQQVRLETSQMLSVFSASFKEALSKIESIANKGNLKPTVKLEKKLETTLPGSGKIPNVQPESLTEPVTSGNLPLIQNDKEENEKSVTPAEPSYSFYCQNCSKKFEGNTLYVNHLSHEHQKNLNKTFGPVNNRPIPGCKPHFHSYKCFTEPDILRVGASLVVTIISHQLNAEPVHLCFACETVFPMKELKFHMNSEKHAVQSLMYQNPWRLPFAWKTRLDYASLKLQACLEEGERGSNKNIRILDVPPHLFPREEPLRYSQVMEKLSLYHPLLMTGVPQRETYSKLQDNDRFPILGRNFLVTYGQITTGRKFLCLLCEHVLSSNDYAGHVFSWQHIVTFLEKFHPGSLDLNTINEEILLDLAKQAARIHRMSNAQEIEFDPSRYNNELMDYSTKVCLLSAKKKRDGKGPLIPPITASMKLFPRQKTKETNAVINIPSSPEKPDEKVVDEVQLAVQVSRVQINEPTEINLQEINNLSTEQELKEKEDPSETIQLEEIKTAKSNSSDCKSMMNTASKRGRSLSDMDDCDSDMENLEPKQICLSYEENEMSTNYQNMNTTQLCSSSETAVTNSVPCYGSDLQSHILRKIRAPLIGLNAIYKCICNDRSPIYLCKCCLQKCKEEHITTHLSDAWHYSNYLNMAGECPLPQGKSCKEDMVKLAADWERREGYGEAHVVKLTPEDYNILDSTCEFNKAFKYVKKYLAGEINENIRAPVLYENFAKTATTNSEETSQQGIQMETDTAPVATSSKTELPSKNEIESNNGTNLTRMQHTMAVDRVSLSVAADNLSVAADKVTVCTPISDAIVSNATKEATDQQDKSDVPKRNAETAVDAKLSSAAPATSIPQTSHTHGKYTGIQLKLNVNEASNVKNDYPVLRCEPLTPSTPNSVPLMPNAETSQKPFHQSPHIGLDQLVMVKCDDKRVVYCFACLVALEGTNHLTSKTHQINCVKKRFSWWDANSGDEELSKMVADLHDAEKASKVEPMKIEVPFEFYKKLKRLPHDKGIEKVRDRIKKTSRKPGQRRLSASTGEASTNQWDISTSPISSVSPCEVTSPDLGKENCQTRLHISNKAPPIRKLPVSSKCSPSPSLPVQKPTSKVAPMILKGLTTEGLSNLTRNLAMMDVSVIGLCFVWECCVPPKDSTLYLCQSCSLTLYDNEICDHMESTEHRLKYLMRRYPQFMYWVQEDLHPLMSNHLTDYIAGLVKGREESVDAQTVDLSEEQFEWVRTAPFVEALNVVQRIKQEKKTATLLRMLMSQQEAEPREGQRTQLTLDASNILADLPNQEEMSIIKKDGEITNTQHEAPSGVYVDAVNAQSCTSLSDTDSVPSPEITELLDFQSQSFSSTNSPKQQQEPAYSTTDQNLATSPKHENQEHSELEPKACSNITSPLSNNLAVRSSNVNTIETTSLVILNDTNGDSKPKADIQLDSPSIQETSTVSPNPLEDNAAKTIEKIQMTEGYSPHDHSDTNGESTSVMASSMVDHNANENPPLDTEDKAALDKHYYLLLINLLKQVKNGMQQTASNQNSPSCSAKSTESNVDLCDEPRHTRSHVGQTLTTDTDATANADNIITENKENPSAKLSTENLTSDTGVSNENVTSISSDNLIKTSTSEYATQQSKEQPVQSNSDGPVKESNIQKQLQVQKIQEQQKKIKIQDVKTENIISDTAVSKRTSQLEIQVAQTESHLSSAVFSEIQRSQCQALLQRKSNTRESLSKYPPHMSHDLMKDMQLDSAAVQLQTQHTQVRVLKQTKNQATQLQPKRLMRSQKATWKIHDQTEKWQCNKAEVQLHTRRLQQKKQRQVWQFVPQTHVAPVHHDAQQTQGQIEQVPNDYLLNSRPHNTMRFRSEFSQGPPPSSVATPPVTSDTMMVTGDYDQFVPTACLTNANTSNTTAQYGVPHGSAYPSYNHHQWQTQQYDMSVQPFLQNVQHPEVSGWFNSNAQPHPVAPNSAWSNGTVGGTSNISFSTANNQSYSYNYNHMQEYNRVLVQNLFYSPSFPPTQTHSQFFPHRQ